MILVAILDALQPVIDALVWIIDIVAGGLGKAVSFISGAVSSLFGGNKGQSVEPMQAGGIVTRPTMALIGEAGPEAVIPLRAGGLGDVINVTVQGNIWAMDDLTDQLRVEFLRIKTDNTTTGF
jgi:phage-related minor tail protein